MKFLFTGSRNWQEVLPVEMVLDGLTSEDSVIVGDCPSGLDLLVLMYCHNQGISIEVVFADWAQYGLAAGPMRNQAMINQKPNAVFAFHEDIKNSKGTKDCIKRAMKANIPVYLMAQIRIKS